MATRAAVNGFRIRRSVHSELTGPHHTLGERAAIAASTADEAATFRAFVASMSSVVISAWRRHVCASASRVRANDRSTARVSLADVPISEAFE